MAKGVTSPLSIAGGRTSDSGERQVQVTKPPCWGEPSKQLRLDLLSELRRQYLVVFECNYQAPAPAYSYEQSYQPLPSTHFNINNVLSQISDLSMCGDACHYRNSSSVTAYLWTTQRRDRLDIDLLLSV